ncbi:hypothetical protein SH2C18_41450 [Clostridium sediminicola]|uniref:L,D-transpeptidase n=1 Tax=Clostridium sediminicola TaxID=3114879 RepID=UPI0031F20E7C
MIFNNTKESKNKKIKLFLLVLISFTIGFSTYIINTKIKMNFLLIKADKAMVSGNYEKAIDIYTLYLSYDSSKPIDDKLEEAIRLEKSKKVYTTAIELMKDKKYLKALDTFKKTNYDEKSISTFVQKCEISYINKELNKAKNYTSEENYKEAILTLNNILLLDKDSLEIKNLIQDYREKYDIEKKVLTLKKKVISERYDFLNNKSSNSYKIEVCIPYQQVYIYKNNELIRTMTCSTGINSKPTPLGYFYTNGKGYYFFSKKYSQGGFYWINFLNNLYLFHSVPVDENKKIISSEASKLGKKASHGCIRLSLDDSKWLYNIVPPYNTLVYIH